jgi:hypothetical protein
MQLTKAAMGSAYISEQVNTVENEFSADSRDKDGKRVVTYETRQAIHLHIASAHIVQIEEVVDRKEGKERSILTLSNGKRLVTARGAAEICRELAKA